MIKCFFKEPVMYNGDRPIYHCSKKNKTVSNEDCISCNDRMTEQGMQSKRIRKYISENLRESK